MSTGQLILLIVIFDLVAVVTAWAVVHGGNRKIMPCHNQDHPCIECQEDK